MEYKARALRKKFMQKDKCLCDVYFEYPEIFDEANEKKSINSFYSAFAENAAEYAKNAAQRIQNEGFTLFLRMHFSIELVSPEKIKISLYITRRNGAKTVFRKSLFQIWDINAEKIIQA